MSAAIIHDRHPRPCLDCGGRQAYGSRRCVQCRATHEAILDARRHRRRHSSYVDQERLALCLRAAEIGGPRSLALAVGVSTVAAWYWVHGHRRVDRRHWPALKEALGLDEAGVAWLMGQG